jgi:H/ACA ribonucleoprotein complex subunit 3
MKLRYCRDCKKYSLKDVCANCGKETCNPLPPRFSPHDKYGKYRRKLKKESLF